VYVCVKDGILLTIVINYMQQDAKIQNTKLSSEYLIILICSVSKLFRLQSGKVSQPTKQLKLSEQGAASRWYIIYSLQIEATYFQTINLIGTSTDL
jgi:hypothetical protein